LFGHLGRWRIHFLSTIAAHQGIKDLFCSMAGDISAGNSGYLV
jgi:hypothetical protein